MVAGVAAMAAGVPRVTRFLTVPSDRLRHMSLASKLAAGAIITRRALLSSGGQANKEFHAFFSVGTAHSACAEV